MLRTFATAAITARKTAQWAGVADRAAWLGLLEAGPSANIVNRHVDRHVRGGRDGVKTISADSAAAYLGIEHVSFACRNSPRAAWPAQVAAEFPAAPVKTTEPLGGADTVFTWTSTTGAIAVLGTRGNQTVTWYIANGPHALSPAFVEYAKSTIGDAKAIDSPENPVTAWWYRPTGRATPAPVRPAGFAPKDNTKRSR